MVMMALVWGGTLNSSAANFSEEGVQARPDGEKWRFRIRFNLKKRFHFRLVCGGPDKTLKTVVGFYIGPTRRPFCKINDVTSLLSFSCNCALQFWEIMLGLQSKDIAFCFHLCFHTQNQPLYLFRI